MNLLKYLNNRGFRVENIYIYKNKCLNIDFNKEKKILKIYTKNFIMNLKIKNIIINKKYNIPVIIIIDDNYFNI